MKRFAPFFILIVVFFTSCSIPQYVTVPVNYGPKMGFRHDSTTIVVINRFNADSVQKIDSRLARVLKTGGYVAITEAVDQLKFLKGVHAIKVADSLNFTANTDSIKHLAAKYKAHYVLALNNYNIGLYREAEYIDGMVVNYFVTKVKTVFTLYESNGIYFKRLSGMGEVPQDERYRMNGSLFYGQSYKSNIKGITQGSRDATLDALKDYLPFSISNERPLYADGGQLETSVMQIKAGKFDVAFKILNPLIDGADAKLASKAAYNLAVVYEAQGDIEEALKTAKLSNEKHPNDYAKAIIVDLMKE